MLIPQHWPTPSSIHVSVLALGGPEGLLSRNRLFSHCPEPDRSSLPVRCGLNQYDPYIIPAGAEAFKKDIPSATVKFLQTGQYVSSRFAKCELRFVGPTRAGANFARSK